MKIVCPGGLKRRVGQAIIIAKNREKLIDNKRPIWPYDIKIFFIRLCRLFEKVGRKQGGFTSAENGVIIEQNREKNILIINAPLSLKNVTLFLSRKGRKSEGKRGVSGGCGNVVNP